MKVPMPINFKNIFEGFISPDRLSDGFRVRGGLKIALKGLQQLISGPGPQTDERRRLVRVKCKVQAIVVRPESDKSSKALIVDMGPKGLRLETSSRLAVGESIRILRPGGDSIGCRVAWSRPKRYSDRFHAGIVFDDTLENLKASWVRSVLEQLGFHPGRIKEYRRSIRVPVEHRAVLANKAGDELLEGKLLDISTGGALFELGISIPEGYRCRLRVDPIGSLNRLEMKATIIGVREIEPNHRYQIRLRFKDRDNSLLKRYLGLFMKGL